MSQESLEDIVFKNDGYSSDSLESISDKPDDESDYDDTMDGGGAEYSEEGEYNEENDKQYKEVNLTQSYQDDEDDDEDDEDENYLMKIDKEVKKNYLLDFHPETIINNYEEIQSLVNIIRDKRGIIIDDFHKTLPFLTKYEKTRILGQRAKQINSGAKSYLDKSMLVENGKPIIDGYLIALKELEFKRIPFIIRRPLPNGASEYWKLEDLDLIN
jgi:DNA-directed RNA polymerase subunit K/omega